MANCGMPPGLVGAARARRFGPDVEIVPAPVDDIWMRDIAPGSVAEHRRFLPIVSIADTGVPAIAFSRRTETRSNDTSPISAKRSVLLLRWQCSIDGRHRRSRSPKE
jgi:hypothetical protein